MVVESATTLQKEKKYVTALKQPLTYLIIVSVQLRERETERERLFKGDHWNTIPEVAEAEVRQAI